MNVRTKGCNFCSGLTFKKVTGGYMYMQGKRLKLCGDSKSMSKDFATDLCSVDFCPVCGNAVEEIETRKIPVCEYCGMPYKIIDDAVSDFVFDKEASAFAVIPVRSVVRSCNCKCKK